jgi:hypothetical protein
VLSTDVIDDLIAFGGLGLAIGGLVGGYLELAGMGMLIGGQAAALVTLIGHIVRG